MADIVMDGLRSLMNKKELNTYDENLCKNIQTKLDEKLKERAMSISEKSIFGRNNYMVMDKWRQIFPEGVSMCLEVYFREKSNWSPRFDPRFPNINQARNCFVNFVDWKRCLKYKGADFKDCDYFHQVAQSMCPNEWLERFEEQIEKDAFPVDF